MRYNSFHPGQVWLDTNGKRIHAHGGSILYENDRYYSALHAADRNCITQEAILREFGRRKHLLRSRVFACPECENNSVIHLPDGTWMCLVCGSRIEETMYCDECGDEIPNSNRIYKTAISDINADDFRFLCPDCAKRYTEEEQFMGYALE